MLLMSNLYTYECLKFTLGLATYMIRTCCSREASLEASVGGNINTRENCLNCRKEGAYLRIKAYT